MQHFIKIRTNVGEFFNEQADRWAVEGRDDVDNVRCDGLSIQWTQAGVKHRCSMNKPLRARVHSKVAELQLPLHNKFTSGYLNREVNSRDFLGKHWQDKTIPNGAKRRLLQSIGYQFPCARLLKLSSIQENDDCRLCKRLHRGVTPWLESLVHIKPDAGSPKTQNRSAPRHMARVTHWH